MVLGCETDFSPKFIPVPEDQVCGASPVRLLDARQLEEQKLLSSLSPADIAALEKLKKGDFTPEFIPTGGHSTPDNPIRQVNRTRIDLERFQLMGLI